MKKKVLHIGKYYYPFRGGIENILKDLCEGIAEDIDTRVICFGDRNITEKINKVEVIRFKPLFVFASQPVNIPIFFKLRKYIQWADIIHIHTPNPLLELIVAIFIGKKTLLSTHHSDIYKQKLLKYLYSPFWAYFKSKVTRFVIPTINHLKYSDMISECKERSSLIPFGIKTDKFSICSTVAKPGLPEKYILFVGRLVEYKGLDYLIKAMINVDYSLIIIGSGPKEYQLKELIKKNQLDDKVKILTKVESQEELNSYYKNAYSFVLPSISKNENFGIVQLEAMYFSLPIITTNIKSGVPAVGRPDKTTLLVEPCSSAELSQAINTLLENTQIATQMGEEGRKLFEQEYKYEIMIKRHISLYNE